MLSYRHAFHAGNFADVLKHIVLVEILEYLGRKDKAFDYIDTHAGAGLYRLDAEQAKKLTEHEDGFGKLEKADWPELNRYFAVIDEAERKVGAAVYPGSPLFSQSLMRHQDRGWLFELHPDDHQKLVRNIGRDRRMKIRQEDGLKGLLALVPPASRRGLVLMDPSYEIKQEYQAVIETLVKAYKKSPTLTYAIWYPVVERSRIDNMDKQLQRSGLRDIQRFELAVQPDSDEKGMTAAGLYIVNPPWTLMQTMQQCLPKLTRALAGDESGAYRAEVLVPE